MRPPKWCAFATPVLAGYPEVVNHDLAVEIGLFRTCSHMISEKPQTGTGEQYIRPFAESLTPTTAHRPESATSPHGSPRTCSTTCHRDTNGHRHGRDAAAPETFAPGLPSMPARCGHNGAAERLRARTRPQQGPLAEPHTGLAPQARSRLRKRPPPNGNGASHATRKTAQHGRWDNSPRKSFRRSSQETETVKDCPAVTPVRPRERTTVGPPHKSGSRARTEKARRLSAFARLRP